MPIDKIIVTGIGLVGLILTYWFFFLKKEEIVEAFGSVTITVEGGYSPNSISVPKNKQTTINFIRKDPSSCLEEVVLPEFKIRKYLPLNEKTSITITPKKEGEFPFSCGMNMFHGRIIVR